MAKRGRPAAMNAGASKKSIVRLQLDVVAKKQLDEFCSRRGMTQIAVVSRVVKWFGRQDEVIQASVLGLLSDDVLAKLQERHQDG